MHGILRIIHSQKKEYLRTMNKKYFSILFLICVFSSAIFAQELTGAFGVPFGTSRTEVVKSAKNAGWTLASSKGKTDVFTTINTKLGNLNINSINFQYDEFDEFVTAAVIFDNIYTTSKLNEIIRTVESMYTIADKTDLPRNGAIYWTIGYKGNQIMLAYNLTKGGAGLLFMKK